MRDPVESSTWMDEYLGERREEKGMGRVRGGELQVNIGL